jgi:hypothetical protein
MSVIDEKSVIDEDIERVRGIIRRGARSAPKRFRLRDPGVIQLRHCRVERTEWGCWTHFPDGTSFGAHPHPEVTHYHVVAHRCGYGDDLLAYCVEHEVARSFTAQKLRDKVSSVLWALAHDEPVDRAAAIEEETMVLMVQRWARANERPLLDGADWDAWRAEFLELVA